MKKNKRIKIKKIGAVDGGRLTAIGTRLSVSGIDYGFLAVVYCLLALGLLMVLSASSPIAFASSMTNHDSYYYFKKQFLWAVLGSIGMLFTINYDYHRLRKLSRLLFAGAFVLLVLVLIPGIGRVVNDARRWIYIGPFNFQPSEAAKIAMIIFFANNLAKNYKELGHFSTFLTYIAIIGMVAAVLMLEPHFSCTMLIATTLAVMIFIAGARWRHIFVIAAPVVVAIVVAVMVAPYRMARVTTFLDPFKDIQGDGWQIVQSLYAIGSGGLFGVGFGQSRQKYMNIPEPQNDFIFPILAEELGLLGAILVIALFVILILRGMRIALKAPDLFGTLLAAGITTMIAIQAIVNIAVVTSSMPVTGMPLPFFSYGGTSLAITMFEMGIVLNISKHSKL